MAERLATADDPPTLAAPSFVGRGREVAALSDALARPPAVVLVEGEPGIGKSRLLDEVLTATATRSTTLMAVSPPLRHSLTLGPVVDALRQATVQIKGLELSALAGALRPLFPEWSQTLPPPPEPLPDAGAAQHRLFRALAELVDALGVELVVLEDAHWADDVTLEFLLFLAARQPAGAPSLLVSYRPEELTDQSLLLRLSSRLPAGSTQLRMALAPLDQPATAALVSSMLDSEPISDEFARYLHERTAGVPLVLEESVRLLHDRADLVLRDGQWVRLSVHELQVPPTVRDSTRERVGRLSSVAQQVLRAAAVVSEPAAESVLAATAGLATRSCQAGIVAAAASGLLAETDPGRWRFRHRLAASAVYESIPSAERSALHLRAGRALERHQPPPVAQLARHFRAAGETARWAHFAELAAGRSIDSGDHSGAVELLIELLRRAPLPPADRSRIAATAASATLARREPVDELHHELVRTLRATLDSPDLTPQQQAEIRNPLGRLLINQGEAEAALSELAQAVTYLDRDPMEAARAMTLLGWAYAGPWPASTHLRWLHRAAELLPRLRTTAERRSLAGNRAAALLMLGEQEAWQVIADLPTDAATSVERHDVCRINTNIATGALIWGRYREARERLTAALALADAEDLVRLRYNILLELANLDWFTGHWDGLARRASELAQADRDRPSTSLAAARLAGRLAAAAGQWRTAEQRFQEVLAEANRHGAVHDTVEPAAALARLRLAEGQVDRALRITDEPIRAVATKRTWLWAVDIAPTRVTALLAAGDVDAATRLVRQFARGLHKRDAPGPRAALAVCRAALAAATGEHARAVAGFARAARAWEALPRPYEALLTRERQAEALFAGGHPESGRELLSQVYERLSTLGARGDSDRVAQRLREHGAVVPRLWRGGRKGYGDRLSPRELEVVRLVVAGKTNREIGRILVKSPATVDQQLRSAMRKLGVSSRTALAVSAVAAGVFAEEGDAESTA
ncbi:AAA family ATPase [Natronosporangium hydrolyticum]|uniref:AAA family ATPase n=1 Tax=Natronosporangium hydrolyticum TaxID=2811111 RepID=A0A895Y6L5_9ACTN|nr:LuxR family transcriptional regulator [Natronosporangium hydrolyticum]QSB13011.1 AAA family ATPase [Natronosporangium hydrolyticum]